MAETSYIIQNGRRLNLKDASARKSIGSCDELETDVKHCLVHAINELNQKVAGGVGEKGEPGEPGEDGVSCTHAWNGTVLTVTSASGTSSADLKGEPGVAGKDGIDGSNGKDGYTPVKGVDYFDGAAGKDGKDGYTPQKGVDYFDGQDGQPGANGQNGVSCTHSWNGTTLTVTSASGTSSADLKGDKGDKGDTGTVDTSVLDNYLPKSGGTMTGAVTFPNLQSIKVAADGGNNTNPTYVAVFYNNNARNGLSYASVSDLSKNIVFPNRLKSYQAGNEKLTDPNLATENGFYYVNSATNRPPFSQSSMNDYRVLTTAYSTAWVQQLATDFRCDDIYYRRCENGTWKPWVRLAFTSDLTTAISECVRYTEDGTIKVQADDDVGAYVALWPHSIDICENSNGDGVYIDAGYFGGEVPVLNFYGTWGDESVILRYVREPEEDYDAANKAYVDNAVANAGGGGEAMTVAQIRSICT